MLLLQIEGMMLSPYQKDHILLALRDTFNRSENRILPLLSPSLEKISSQVLKDRSQVKLYYTTST